MEVLLNIAVLEFRSRSPQIRHLAPATSANSWQLLEMGQGLQLRATRPHALGAKMTGVPNKLPRTTCTRDFDNRE